MSRDTPSWLDGHFWCDICARIMPMLPWWQDMVADSVWILGQEFSAVRCQACNTVKVWKKQTPQNG
jgi:thiol-disulfide isomerase/thioredoxin